MPNLLLRPTVIGGDTPKHDFKVIFDGRPIGRIRKADERIGHKPGWDWTINPPLPIPTWCRGSEPHLAAAKDAFREAWVRFYASLAPSDIAHWYHSQDAAQRRRA